MTVRLKSNLAFPTQTSMPGNIVVPRVFSVRGRWSISEHLPDKVQALRFESTPSWSLLHLTGLNQCSRPPSMYRKRPERRVEEKGSNKNSDSEAQGR